MGTQRMLRSFIFAVLLVVSACARQTSNQLLERVNTVGAQAVKQLTHKETSLHNALSGEHANSQIASLAFQNARIAAETDVATLKKMQQIQKLDQEAMIDSDKVQSLAENMDHSLGHSLKMMRKADKGLQHSMVSKKKTAPSSLKKPTKDVPPFLGESRNTGTFKERLERVKTRVNGEVEAAQTGLDTLRASRKSMHKQEKRQIQKDHRIIAAMTTAKTLLDQDLKGHEDKKLE